MALKYNPETVKNYTAKELVEIRKNLDKMEASWKSLFAKIRNLNAKGQANEAKKIAKEMTEMQVQIELYRAISINSTHKNANIVDLHQLTIKGALRVLEEFLELKLNEFQEGNSSSSTLHIITGQGKHNKDGKPVLRPVVGNYLSEKGLRHSLANAGCFYVHLTKTSAPAMP